MTSGTKGHFPLFWRLWLSLSFITLLNEECFLDSPQSSLFESFLALFLPEFIAAKIKAP